MNTKQLNQAAIGRQIRCIDRLLLFTALLATAFTMHGISSTHWIQKSTTTIIPYGQYQEKSSPWKQCVTFENRFGIRLQADHCESGAAEINVRLEITKNLAILGLLFSLITIVIFLSRYVIIDVMKDVGVLIGHLSLVACVTHGIALAIYTNTIYWQKGACSTRATRSMLFWRLKFISFDTVSLTSGYYSMVAACLLHAINFWMIRRYDKKRFDYELHVIGRVQNFVGLITEEDISSRCETATTSSKTSAIEAGICHAKRFFGGKNASMRGNAASASNAKRRTTKTKKNLKGVSKSPQRPKQTNRQTNVPQNVYRFSYLQDAKN